MRGRSVTHLARLTSMSLAGVTAALHCTLESIEALIPENGTVNYIEKLAEGVTFVDSDGALPATDLPSGCAVGYSAPSSANSTLRIALLLPDKWNGRFMTSGGSGFSGATSWPDMGFYGHYGFASMSTNQGHTSLAKDARWALKSPEAIIDWAHRGIHLAARYSKDVVEGYYGSDIAYSYYTGCSTGGRQGLKLLDLYPEDFDGALIGSPALSLARLASWYTQLGIWNLPVDDPGRIPPALLSLIAAEQIRLCDDKDGVVDGIIMDPTLCRPSLAHLWCSEADNNQTAGSCLTDAQLKTLSRLSGDWTDANGTLLAPTFEPGSDFTVFAGGDAEPRPLGTTYLANMIFNDTKWDWRTLNADAIRLAEEVNPGGAEASQSDYSAFRDRGGKMIMYHGYADEYIPPQSSLRFRDRILRAMGDEAVGDFFRLYLMPGVKHCFHSYNGAPWAIGGVGQGETGTRNEGPGYVDDAGHNALLALVRWVEGGEAPRGIVASKFVNDSVALGVVSQRPVCAYPEKAFYVGGTMERAESWDCRA